MGLLLKKDVGDNCLLGVWEIKEDFETLFNQVKLTKEENETLDSFLNHQRKLEWLSVRVLMNTLLEKDCRIVYNEERKPFLACNTHNISISHSKNLTSILVSKQKKVGIDLEFMSHQIDNISGKFINDNEQITSDPKLKRLHLYIHWCAKEALYKICDKQDINFKQNLTIKPFHIHYEGKLDGIVDNRFGHELFMLNYFLIDEYVVVWCCK
jgi:4'-phosphopantetheinyl transferase